MNLKIECVIPVLPVNKLEASLGFYMQTLGFTIDWGDNKRKQDRFGISRLHQYYAI